MANNDNKVRGCLIMEYNIVIKRSKFDTRRRETWLIHHGTLHCSKVRMGWLARAPPLAETHLLIYDRTILTLVAPVPVMDATAILQSDKNNTSIISIHVPYIFYKVRLFIYTIITLLLFLCLKYFNSSISLSTFVQKFKYCTLR
jgi:hypothetical protein